MPSNYVPRYFSNTSITGPLNRSFALNEQANQPLVVNEEDRCLETKGCDPVVATFTVIVILMILCVLFIVFLHKHIHIPISMKKHKSKDDFDIKSWDPYNGMPQAEDVRTNVYSRVTNRRTALQPFNTDDVCLTSICVSTSAKMLEIMNVDADPCHNFYEFACGNWVNTRFVPTWESVYNRFKETYHQNTEVLLKILETKDVSFNRRKSTAIAKSLSFYRTCMNYSAIEEIGSQPLKDLINELGGWPMIYDGKDGFIQWNEEEFDLTSAIIKTHSYKINTFFHMALSIDDKNSSVYRIAFEQGGLSFDSHSFRGYYVNNKKYDSGIEYEYSTFNMHKRRTQTSHDKLKTSILDYGKKIIKLLHPTPIDEEVIVDGLTKVFMLETRIAKIFEMKLQDLNSENPYNLMDLVKFQDILHTSNNRIRIEQYLREMFDAPYSFPPTEQVIVYTPKYFRELSNLLSATPKETIQNYMLFFTVQELAAHLSLKYQLVRKELTYQIKGTMEDKPRWQICARRTDSVLGYVTGLMFVTQTFTNTTQKEAKFMVEMIRDSFINNLPNLDWMDKRTRRKAEDKAKSIYEKIGFPRWLNYDDAVDRLDKYYSKLVSADNYFLNYLNSRVFQIRENLEKYGDVPDQEDWTMTPVEVNAYYAASRNTIVFPAGILQWPFYHAQSDIPAALNFGSAGMIVGHELTHGFDNSGRLYDALGNLNDWWGKMPKENFAKRAKCFVNQYSKFPIANKTLNGIFTLDENIADNGGIKIAHNAYARYKAMNSVLDEDEELMISDIPRRRDRILPGLRFTDEQLFFLSFAQTWCARYTTKAAEMSVTIDTHSFAKYRVIGVLSNMVPFAKAFNCSLGTVMNPESKCEIW
ncbi:hypothetical protein SNEBB_008785 [Seison nebaliae]|nr:hypothetical protein SNEBB_008785 [Seison nebaliae]